MSIVLRLKEYIDYKKINIATFEKSVGISNASFGKPAKTGGSIGTDKLEKILSVYTDISPEWLLTGKGAMLKREEIPSVPIGDKVTIYDSPTTKGLPYYDVDIAAGFDEFIDNPSFLPTYYIDFKPYNHASFWCNVTGRSMEPVIHHGDIVALKECRLEEVLYGEIYAVIMDDVRTIKIVRKGSSPDKIKLVPINTEEFDEQEFLIKNLRVLYKVVGNMRPCF